MMKNSRSESTAKFFKKEGLKIGGVKIVTLPVEIIIFPEIVCDFLKFIILLYPYLRGIFPKTDIYQLMNSSVPSLKGSNFFISFEDIGDSFDITIGEDDKGVPLYTLEAFPPYISPYTQINFLKTAKSSVYRNLRNYLGTFNLIKKITMNNVYTHEILKEKPNQKTLLTLKKDIQEFLLKYKIDISETPIKFISDFPIGDTGKHSIKYH